VITSTIPAPVSTATLFEVMTTGEGAFIVDFGTTVRDRTDDFS
jgi:hypothetical protein